MVDNLLSRIEELKRRKGAVILAHYYTLPEVLISETGPFCRY